MESSDSVASASRWVSRFSTDLNCFHPFHRFWVRWMLLLWVLSVTAMPSDAAVDARMVQQAIDRGVTYLKKSQTERGGWTEYSGQSCGLSSLCTMALLNSGVSPEDPVIQKALQYLRGFEPEETYSVSLQTLAFCYLGAAADLPRIRRNIDWLVSQQRLGDPLSQRGGSWDYGRQRGSGDPSNSQFALLALSAAAELGIEIDSNVFRRSLEYWQIRQSKGGWSYGNSPRLSGSMTCAGIASTVIANQCLNAQGILKIECCGEKADGSQSVERGLQWLGENFTLQVNPGGDSLTFFYYLYALERVGRLTGRRFIGGHDWYREGAERLLALQDKFVGFWSGSGAMEQNRDIATSFALLFLSKGKRQVVIGRVKYGPKLAEPSQLWERHPQALQQLVRHTERDWGRDLSWQTIDLESAQLQDLLQAPVLILSGSESFQFGDNVSARLKEYIDQGGCLLFEAEAGEGCGEAKGFEQSVSELCGKWFGNVPLERLPPTHLVWTARHKVNPSMISPEFWVYGIQACCRTAVFYFPQSVSCRWQYGDRLLRQTQNSERIQAQKASLEQVSTAIHLGENIIAYATGRELKDKLEQHVVLNGEAVTDVQRAEIRLATLALAAGAEEAQRTVPNAASLISSRLPIRLVSPREPVGFDREALQDVPFLWIHGRQTFSFSAEQRQVMRDYIESGGIVIGASLCGSEAFTRSFRSEWEAIFPELKFEKLQPEDELFQIKNGFDIRSVVTRRFDGAGKLSKNTGSPVLERMKYDGLAAVFLSPLDLSCALESPNSVQCPGYETEVAAKIAANIVLFCLQQ